MPPPPGGGGRTFKVHGNRPHSFGTIGSGSEPPRARRGQSATACLARAPHLQRQRAGMSAMRVSPPKSFSAWAGGNRVRLRHVPQRTSTPRAPSEMAFCNVLMSQLRNERDPMRVGGGCFWLFRQERQAMSRPANSSLFDHGKATISYCAIAETYSDAPALS